MFVVTYGSSGSIFGVFEAILRANFSPVIMKSRQPEIVSRWKDRDEVPHEGLLQKEGNGTRGILVFLSNCVASRDQDIGVLYRNLVLEV